MPKVSEEYKINKKKEILNATLRVCKTKTLISINMQDIINESKLSQGNIYRYYKDIDEIIAELLSNLRNEANIKDDIDLILSKEQSFDETLSQILFLLGDFMENGMDTYCKLDFEFNSLAMNYPERANKIVNMIDKTSFSNLGYLMEKTISRLSYEASKGILSLKVSPSSFASYISATYMGIEMTALQSYNSNGKMPWENYRPIRQMELLGMSLKSMIKLESED